MKRLLKHLFLCLILFSCSDNDDHSKSETTAYLGKWKLTQELIDPGDGSGIFVDVTGNRTLEFLSNGNIVSNYSLCEMGPETTTTFTTPYLADEDQISTASCGFPEGVTISYHLDGENLILSFPCIEGCAQKFERVSN
ncbi:hypothetical protein [Flavobacterium sp.]|uniref:hypothetical protein n=1 Tax=Flavobacterium sp. TaxID=239 RepID=UPI002FDB2610